MARKRKGLKKLRAFRVHVLGLVVQTGGLDLSGAEKHAKVVRAAAEKWLDDMIEPGDPLLELGSDVLIRVASRFVAALVEDRYQSAKRRGLVSKRVLECEE